MLRMTNTDKWRDTFFYNLMPAPKLVFIYLYENCNDAGFMDLNYEQMRDLMKLEKDRLEKCLTALESRYIKNNDGTKIWLKNYLLHQNKLPINIKTEEGRRILNLLETNSNSFESPFIKAIIDDAFRKKIPIQRVTKVFIKPSLDEVVKHFSSGETAKVGNKPMVSWVAAFSGCLKRENKKRGVQGKGSDVKQTRFEAIVEANNTPINYENL